jgi:hypothetical protein
MSVGLFEGRGLVANSLGTNWISAERASSIDFQTGRAVALKIDDEPRVASQKRLDHAGRLVAAPKPNHLWRRAEQSRHVRKIGVERDESEFVDFA